MLLPDSMGHFCDSPSCVQCFAPSLRVMARLCDFSRPKGSALHPCEVVQECSETSQRWEMGYGIEVGTGNVQKSDCAIVGCWVGRSVL